MSETGTNRENAGERRRILGIRVATIAGGYCLVVAATLLALWLQPDPFDTPETTALHEVLRRHPEDAAARELIRQRDLEHRRDYFLRQRRIETGSVLLLIGGLVLVASMRVAADNVSDPPRIPTTPPAEEHWDLHAVNRRSLAAVTVAVLFGALIVGTVTQAPIRPTAARLPAGSGAPPVAARAPAVDAAGAWPRFRGPGGLGLAAVGADIPLAWSVAEKRNILWRVPVPLPGNSSPAVWGDRVIVTGGDERTREVYAFDAESGALLWRRAIPAATHAKPPKTMFGTGYASPSPAIDDGRIFVVFATGDVAALDLDGALLWTRHMGVPDNPYGHASSPVAHDGKVFVQIDVGQMASDEMSELHALDARTGNLLWMVSRPVSASWSTPLMLEAEGRGQLALSAPPWLMAYDPHDGAELWRANLVAGEIAASPVQANGLVYVASEQCVAAVRADGTGDVTESHVVWQQYDGLPDTVSPLTDGALLFLATSYGQVTCYDARTGELLWTHDFEAEFYASPSLAGDTVLLADRSGIVHLFAAAREFKPIAKNDLGEPIHASPAFGRNRIWFRGEKHLIGVASDQ